MPTSSGSQTSQFYRRLPFFLHKVDDHVLPKKIKQRIPNVGKCYRTLKPTAIFCSRSVWIFSSQVKILIYMQLISLAAFSVRYPQGASYNTEQRIRVSIPGLRQVLHPHCQYTEENKGNIRIYVVLQTDHDRSVHVRVCQDSSGPVQLCQGTSYLSRTSSSAYSG